MATALSVPTPTQKSKQVMPPTTKALRDAPNKPYKYFTCESETIVAGGRNWWYLGLRRYPPKKVYACTNDETEKKVTLYQKLTQKIAK